MMRPRHRPYRTSGGGGGGLAVASTLAYGVGGLALAAAAVAAALAYASMTQKQRRRAGVSREQWEAAVAESGEIVGFEQIVHDAAQRGLAPEARADAWPFLLGVFSPESTYEDRRRHHALMAQQYQQLLLQCQALEAALRDCTRGGAGAGGREAPAAMVSDAVAGVNLDAVSPGAAAAAAAYELPAQVVQFAEAHRIIVIDAVRTDFRRAAVAPIYSSVAAGTGAATTAGLEEAPAVAPGSGATLFGPTALPDLRLSDSWVAGWLGGAAATGGWGTAPHERLWVSEAAQHVLDSSSHLGPEGRHQAARLIALLSAYAIYDPETGYCQGMSDLAAPLLVLFEDDAIAFWCFAALMRTFGARGNFAVDESGIFSQLRALAGVLGRADRVLAHKLQAMGAGDCHFAYRMVVVAMRRDLPLGQVMTLWELLWADARRQLLARQRRDARSAAGAILPVDAVGAPLITADPSASTDDDDPKAALKRAQGLASDARAPADESEAADFLSAAAAEMFIHFVAAVVIGARRRVLDECTDTDDAMRLFHTLRGVDFWECVNRATVLRASGSSRKHR